MVSDMKPADAYGMKIEGSVESLQTDPYMMN
jgi:hypothetical protein